MVNIYILKIKLFIKYYYQNKIPFLLKNNVNKII